MRTCTSLHAARRARSARRQARSIAFVERFVDQRADRNVALEQLARQPSRRQRADAPLRHEGAHVVVDGSELDAARLGQRGRIKRMRVGDGTIERLIEQVAVRAIGRDERHDRYPEPALQHLRVDALALGLGDVHEVQHEHAGAIDAREVGEHVQASFQLRGVREHAYDVGPARGDVVARDHFLLRIRREAVGAGKIAHRVIDAAARKTALLLLHRLARPVPHALPRTGQRVEQG